MKRDHQGHGYEVVRELDHDKFEDRVNLLVAWDWEPCGGFQVVASTDGQHWFHQAMIKEPPLTS